ncbi:MAG: tetratricopeptide repeat protein, partial [Alphaproteobacteria bacterium]
MPNRGTGTRQYGDAQQMLGLALNKLGDRETAVKHLATAANLDSSNSKLQSSLGGILGQLGRAAEAKKAFEAALASDPGNTFALYGLGRIAETAGKPKPAIRYYRKVLDFDPQDATHGAQLRLTQLGARKMPPRTPQNYMCQFYAERA